MPPPNHVVLGPLTRTVLTRASWREETEFPAHQSWADESERVLSFLEAAGVLGRFLPRLCAREWEGAFAEARAAFFFKRNGFRILAWEPEAVPGRPGDLELQWRDTEPIFVEVKKPGWEGELTREQLQAGRTRLPKYMNNDARAVDPIERVTFAIDKALSKFSPTRINLAVIVDDLFLSPTELPRVFREGRLKQELGRSEFKLVSAVLMLNPASYADEGSVEYRKYFLPNPAAIRPIPDAVNQGLLNGNNDPQGPRWRRETDTE